jgi:hypothetical protein
MRMIDQLDLCSGERWSCWKEIEVPELNAPDCSLGNRAASDQDVVNRESQRITSNSDATRGIALRIAIYEQCSLLSNGETGGEIDGCGRLADTALLVGYSDDSGHRGIVVQGAAIYGRGTQWKRVVSRETSAISWHELVEEALERRFT